MTEQRIEQLCGCPLDDGERVAVKDLYVFVAGENLPVKGKQKILQNLKGRMHYEMRTSHLIIRQGQRELTNYKLDEILNYGTIVQMSFEKTTGLLRYIGFRLQDEVFILQVEEYGRQGSWCSYTVTGWKVPSDRSSCFENVSEISLSTKTWGYVEWLRAMWNMAGR